MKHKYHQLSIDEDNTTTPLLVPTTDNNQPKSCLPKIVKNYPWTCLFAAVSVCILLLVIIPENENRQINHHFSDFAEELKISDLEQKIQEKYTQDSDEVEITPATQVKINAKLDNPIEQNEETVAVVVNAEVVNAKVPRTELVSSSVPTTAGPETESGNALATEYPPLKKSRKQILIVTEYRSGSSFIGETFNKNYNLFYLFEPLILTAYPEIGNKLFEMDVAASQKMIKEYFVDCKLPNPNEILTDEQYARAEEARVGVWNDCKRQNLCFQYRQDVFRQQPFCPEAYLQENAMGVSYRQKCGPVKLEVAQELCKKSDATTAKVIRLERLSELKETVQKYAKDLKIMYYVRDPRGLAESRFGNNWKWNAKNMHRLDNICIRYKENMKYLNSPESKWLKENGRFFVLRYEDFGLNPFKISEDIYDYYDIDKRGYDGVVDYFKISTEYNMDTKLAKTMWTTQRNSSQTVLRWREYVNWEGVEKVQNECGEEVMKWLGYNVYTKNEYTMNERTGKLFTETDVHEKPSPFLKEWAFKGRFYNITDSNK